MKTYTTGRDCDALPSRDLIKSASEAMEVKIGHELAEFLSQYGWFESPELTVFGLDSRKGLNSDLVRETVQMHTEHGFTYGYILLCRMWDGRLIFCDHSDRIYTTVEGGAGFVSANVCVKEYLKWLYEHEKISEKT